MGVLGDLAMAGKQFHLLRAGRLHTGLTGPSLRFLYYKMGFVGGSNDGKPEKRVAQCSRVCSELYRAVGMTVTADGWEETSHSHVHKS